MTQPIEAVIGSLLRSRGLKLVVAESCTGGLVGHLLTNISGSSDYYLGSVTAYAYEAKRLILGVRPETLIDYGAVSREVVLQMAAGVRAAFSGDEIPIEDVIGVSVSGIAGPGGGMPGKPVGLVWIGLSAQDGDWAWKYVWEGDRIRNKELSAQQTLRLIYLYLKGQLPSQDG